MLAPMIGVLLTAAFFYATERISDSQTQLLQQLSDADLPFVAEINRSITSIIALHMEFSHELHEALEHPRKDGAAIHGQHLRESFVIQSQRIQNRLFDYVGLESEEIPAEVLLRFTRYKDTILRAIDYSDSAPEKAMQELHASDDMLEALNTALQKQVELHLQKLDSSGVLIENTLAGGRVTAMLAAAMFLGMIFLGLYFSGRLSRDIDTINRQLVKLGQGNTDIQFDQHSDAYLRPLVEAAENFR